jgi:GNAT superfamily N-acetyltransferase
MSESLLEIEEIALGDPRIKEFVELPWRLYRNDRFWTPPLRGELLGNRLLGQVGILTKQHPYHHHAEVTHFLALRDGRPVGRVAAAVNRRFVEHHGKIGSFGFFEVGQDYEAAEALLGRASDWVRARGMTVIRGPGEYSNATHERQGVLVDGFEFPPTVELTHNPPYYDEFLKRYGFTKAMDYHAYIASLQSPDSPRLGRLLEKVRARREIEIRQLNPKDLNNEVRLIISIYNDTWSRNWGFLQITDEEADSLAESIRMIIDPGIVRFAFVGGEPAAVLGAFPDPNYALRPRWRWYGDSDAVRISRLMAMRGRIPRMRLMFFGVRPGFRNMGIDALLYHEVKSYAAAHGYKECESSMLLENNDAIIRAAAFMGGHKYKTWRIYDLKLD